jgi:hypothetical protein
MALTTCRNSEIRNLEENNKERLHNFMVRLYDYRANLFNSRLGPKTLR